MTLKTSNWKTRFTVIWTGECRSELYLCRHSFHISSLSECIFEITGSYQDAFFVAGAAITAGSCTLLFTRLFLPDEATRERKEIREETPGKEQTAHGSEKANEIAAAEGQSQVWSPCCI